jgi:biopolymer transport protein TolQ
MVGNSLWYLIAQSDGMSLTVLVILLCMSILSWTMAIWKVVGLRFKNWQLESFYSAIDGANFTFEDLVKYVAENRESISGDFVAHQLALFSFIFNRESKHTSEHDALLREMIDNGLSQSIDQYVTQESRILSLFATFSGAAPLLGLLGTVWGLIHSFMRISQTQVADIATIAPGISEALITTLAGLMVAIPALIMFNYVNMQIQLFEQQIEALADRYRMLVHGLFLRNLYASQEKKSS